VADTAGQLCPLLAYRPEVRSVPFPSLFFLHSKRNGELTLFRGAGYERCVSFASASPTALRAASSRYSPRPERHGTLAPSTRRQTFRGKSCPPSKFLVGLRQVLPTSALSRQRQRVPPLGQDAFSHRACRIILTRLGPRVAPISPSSARGLCFERMRSPKRNRSFFFLERASPYSLFCLRIFSSAFAHR